MQSRHFAFIARRNEAIALVLWLLLRGSRDAVAQRQRPNALGAHQAPAANVYRLKPAFADQLVKLRATQAERPCRLWDAAK